jgi:hypothetical protein
MDDEDILKDEEDKWLQKRMPELYAWIIQNRRK